MLSPNPLSLFCAILLCLPLALVFTITSDTTISVITTTTVSHPRITIPSPLLKPPKTPRKNYTHFTTTPNVTTPNVTTTNEKPPPPPPSPTTTTLPLPEDKHDDVAFLEWASGVDQDLPEAQNKVKPIVKNVTLHKGASQVPRDRKRPRKKVRVKKPLPPPPSPVVPKDDRDDVELLKRASRVNPSPTGPKKKVAFMFLTTSPLPFAPLWELFFNQSEAHGLYNIYIHADSPKPKYDKLFTGVFAGRVIPSSKPTRRNTPTLITAARRLLAHALLDDPDNYMFTLLSGACVPLHSFNFTYNTLVNSPRSFIEVLSNESTAYGRWAARGEHAMLPEVPLEDFRIGSQFWSITRRHARVVVEDVKLWKKFRLPCVNLGACYPEENYFPTLLSMVDPHGVVPATLTNVNWWGRNDGHPHTYNGSEVGPELIRWLRDRRPRYGDLGFNGSDLFVMERWDPFLFARKFAPNCVQPLVSLAKDVLFKD